MPVARFGCNSSLYQGLSHLSGLLEERVVQIQSLWDILVLNALHHCCQTFPFCTSNHLLEEDPKQKPTKNIYLALCVIAKQFTGTARGVPGSTDPL